MAYYRKTKKADADLARIFEYGIDNFGAAQAIKYLKDLELRFEAIAENPFMYTAVDDIRKGYRRSVCGVHSIYYRINMNNGVVEIMRLIKRGKTDFTTLEDDLDTQ